MKNEVNYKGMSRVFRCKKTLKYSPIAGEDFESLEQKQKFSGGFRFFIEGMSNEMSYKGMSQVFRYKKTLKSLPIVGEDFKSLEQKQESLGVFRWSIESKAMEELLRIYFINLKYDIIEFKLLEDERKYNIPGMLESIEEDRANFYMLYRIAEKHGIESLKFRKGNDVAYVHIDGLHSTEHAENVLSIINDTEMLIEVYRDHGETY